MPTGTFKQWSVEHKFGFIKTDDGGADVFCHATRIQPEPPQFVAVGQRVRFDVGINPRNSKIEVQNVVLLNG